MNGRAGGSGDNVDSVHGSDNVDSVRGRDKVDSVPFVNNDIAAARGDVNARGLKIPPKEYAMDKRNRGIAIIINNELFHPETNLSEREGSDIDQQALRELFKELEFEVREYRNLTCEKMENLMEEVAGESHTNNDCFMCAMMSHGDEESIYGVDGPIDTQELIEYFQGDKCRSLAGKPKIFFIQACRGRKSDGGVCPEEGGGREICEERIPIGADFLIAYSVVPGYVSYRNSAHGSWFVQAIIAAFKDDDDHKEDLMTLMTRVNSIVAYNFEMEDTKEKQMPCITTTLTKAVYFKNKQN